MSHETLLLQGLIGPIEVLLDHPPQAPIGTAVVAHPQPLMGGHAQHKIPRLLAAGLVELGWRVARPQFRGVGDTAGTHTGGVGETEDLLSVCMALGPFGPHHPLVLVGFSFGAYVQALVSHRLHVLGSPPWRVFLAGTPSGTVEGGRHYDTPTVPPGTRVVHGEHDERVPLQAVLDWARPQMAPVVVVPGADHFFSGRLHVLRQLLLAHVAVASNTTCT